MQRLQGRWHRRLEVEAKECEHAERRERLDGALADLGSRSVPNELVTPVSRPAPLLAPLPPAQKDPQAESRVLSRGDMPTQPNSSTTGTGDIIYDPSRQRDSASPEERAIVPNHLTGDRVEELLEEFLAIKAVIKAEAEKIWNGCSNLHQMISVATDDEKRRLLSGQYDKWRDQLAGLQEILIVDRLATSTTIFALFKNLGWEEKYCLSWQSSSFGSAHAPAYQCRGA
jgi:hypothetical protein